MVLDKGLRGGRLVLDQCNGSKIMETVGAYEARTHLPALLRRVEQGEEITITRHGVVVAVLSPVPRTEARKSDFRKTIKDMVNSREGCRLDGLSIREAIDDGRP
jgi:prevent-host-death family protein